MSSRALRKLHGNDDLVTKVTEEHEEDKEDDYVQDGKNVFNPFDVLNEDAGDDILEDKGDEPDVPETETVVVKHKSETAKKRKKKKKKSNKDLLGSNKENCDEDEIDASLREVNELLGETPVYNTDPDNTDKEATWQMRALLNVEHKHLNPENEMKRIFGSQVVQAEQSRRRDRGRGRQVRHRATWLTKPKDSWPPIGKFGISMSNEGNGRFNFEHSKEYQRVEFLFYDAVESFNPQNIMNILNGHPYHIDCLIQLSEICRMGEDVQMATELIERALYCFELNFHPLFSMTSGNCRLDYRRPENRAFFLALFRHILFVGQKGCHRTSLEFCKLILSFDPDNDPLAILLMVDFYALRCEQFSFLIRMYHEWEAHKNLSQLPNFAMSIPLAMYHEAMQQKSSLEHADKMLQNSLLAFPGLLMPLLEKCSITPDKEVSSHMFFGTETQISQPDALKQLVALYAGRCWHCWKAADVMTWLECNVRQVITRVSQGEPLAEEYRNKAKVRYKGTPRNVYRHIILSEIKDATASMPPEMANTPVMSYDPLPPLDSITSYTRPSRPTRAQQGTGILSSFLQSLLPNYNPQEQVDEDLGAAGGVEGLREGVGALMEAMRDLLNNIRPVDPPREDEHAQDRDAEGEADQLPEDQEWD